MCILCAGVAAAATTGVLQVPLVAARAAAAGANSPHIVVNWVRPVLFSVGFFNLYTYGICVAGALIGALTVFANQLKRASIPMDETHCFFTFLVGFGIGSKGHFLLSEWGAGANIWVMKSLDMRNGHSFMGSIIGGTVFLLVLAKWHKVSLLKFLDALLPCCLIGHVVGKIGCFVSGDGCYGRPANPIDVPWAMSFPNGAEPTMVPVHPTPIYEGTMSLTIALIALIFFPMPRPLGTDGRRAALVLVLYGISRCCVEPFRKHPPVELFMGLTEYQALAVCLFFIGCLIELKISVGEESSKRKGKSKKEKAEIAESDEASAPTAKQGKKSKKKD